MTDTETSDTSDTPDIEIIEDEDLKEELIKSGETAKSEELERMIDMRPDLDASEEEWLEWGAMFISPEDIKSLEDIEDINVRKRKFKELAHSSSEEARKMIGERTEEARKKKREEIASRKSKSVVSKGPPTFGTEPPRRPPDIGRAEDKIESVPDHAVIVPIEQQQQVKQITTGDFVNWWSLADIPTFPRNESIASLDVLAELGLHPNFIAPLEMNEIQMFRQALTILKDNVKLQRKIGIGYEAARKLTPYLHELQKRRYIKRVNKKIMPVNIQTQLLKLNEMPVTPLNFEYPKNNIFK